MHILAIDQGTTSTRALVSRAPGGGEIVAAIEHRQIYPQPGWVEHDPEELLCNIQQCIDKSLRQYPDISAIGFDNQGESCLAWDAESKQAISPVIVWQDSRTQSVIDALKNNGVESTVTGLSGLPLDAYFSASKLAWIMNNIPAARALHRRGKLCLGTSDAFFMHRLTGRFVSDITTASRTSLMDLKSGQWSPQLCELFGVPLDALPKIVATSGDFGSLKSGKRSIAVTASIVDQQAALYGHGCRETGDAKITFGTGAFALVLTGEEPYRSPEQGLLPTVAWKMDNLPAAYALDGAVYSAGSAINWAKSLRLFDSFSQINQFSRSSSVEHDLVFVPALTGLACPHWDRRAAGMWLGLSLDTSPIDMVQSVLEGIAFRAGEVIQAMHQVTPIATSISIDGGVSANPYFCQFLSEVLNREIRVQTFAELTALGTALLASGESTLDDGTNQAQTVYQPRRDMRPYAEKFSQAIGHTKQWLSETPS